MGTTIKLDSQSDLSVKMPANDEEIIAIAAAYLAKEAAQLPESQLALPVLADVQAAYVAASTAVDAADSAEHSRANAGEAYDQMLAIIQDRLQWALKGRSRQFPTMLTTIENWGVDTIIGATGRLMVFPTRQAGWRKLLNDYIAKEESLAPEAQWTDPPLSDFETWREQIQTHDATRQQWLNVRKASIVARKEETAVLKQHLRMALHALIYSQFGGKIKFALTEWGFPVQYRQAGKTTTSSEPPDEEPAAETAVAGAAMSAPASTLETAPLTSSTNGAAR